VTIAWYAFCGSGGSGGSVGITFAIPINVAKSLLPTLEKGGTASNAGR
jgi:S1-C subfamily serine protease